VGHRGGAHLFLNCNCGVARGGEESKEVLSIGEGPIFPQKIGDGPMKMAPLKRKKKKQKECTHELINYESHYVPLNTLTT